MGIGTVDVQAGGNLDIDGALIISSGSTANIDGGTIWIGDLTNTAVIGTFNFNYGTLGLDCDVTVTDTGLLNDAFGASPDIAAPNAIEITGTATLLEPVTRCVAPTTAKSQMMNHKKSKCMSYPPNFFKTQLNVAEAATTTIQNPMNFNKGTSSMSFPHFKNVARRTPSSIVIARTG